MPQLNRKLTILHTEASLGWGGQEIRVLVELREMARRGHRTVIVTPPSSDIFHKALDAQIETVPLSMWRRDFFRNLRWLSDYLKREKVDVVNTHSSRDSWLAGLAAKRAGVPLVIKTRHISARISRGWMTRFAYQRLHDYIITTSSGIAGDMVRYNGFAAERISSIPTGIDLRRYDPDIAPLDLRKELGLPERSQLVGMVSVLRSWKGHPDFLQAAVRVRKERPDTFFVIVGEGPRREHIEQEVLEREMEDFVFLIGYRDEIPQILKALDVFVLPSYANEGVPQALLQALAMARPVVATAVGGIPEVVRDGEQGMLCEAQNSEALAGLILKMLEDPARARAMGMAGRMVVEKEFSLDRMVGKLEDIYAQMLP
ncbi:MAG: glycosyltransferase [Verrucomicrobiae bacterium]|nr:glycosyltransferase [Verrucomicrobiae bacterium]